MGNSNDRKMFRIMSQLKCLHCIGKCSDPPGKIFRKQDNDDNSKWQENQNRDQQGTDQDARVILNITFRDFGNMEPSIA